MASSPAASASPYDVIAPGQEQLLADMLGRGAALPGDCKFSNGQVETALVRGTFQCAAGSVVVELRHPSQTQDAVATTDRFAVSVRSGSPPPDLVPTLVARIREREAAFVWTSPGSTGGKARKQPLESIYIDPRLIQIAWVVAILTGPILCWRGAQAIGVDGAHAILAIAIPVVLTAGLTWNRADEPLHANGHAWREAREVLAPWGGRSTGGKPFMHGEGGIALQWLLADVEHRLGGSANPFGISRWVGAAAAGATAFLALVLVRSWWAGLVAGCVLALLPLAQIFALSGSSLTIAGWILPWTLGLSLAAGLSGDPFLLAGATLAAALGTLSHTAMLAWPSALIVAWLIVARRRLRLVALGALLLLVAAFVAELANVFEVIASRNQGPGGGLLAEAWRGIVNRNLLFDSQWVSPFLAPMAVLWLLTGVRHLRLMLASAAGLAIVAAPFFAVTQCSSDAVRYQGALLGLISAIAVAGVWSIPLPAQLGTIALSLIRSVLVAALVLLPSLGRRPSLDPVSLEHQLVADAVERLEPGTLVILPKGRFDEGRIIPDFPDFMLPESSEVVFEGDPRIAAHAGPHLAYLGLACISWNDGSEADLTDLRPECRTLRSGARPWAVRTLQRDDLPRLKDGTAWTFHHLAIGVPFGFFEIPKSR